MRRVFVGLAAAAICAGTSLIDAGPASALSCEGSSSGDVVLVGTVVSVRSRLDGIPEERGTWARVAVQEVWRNWPSNEPIAERVEIRGGPKLDGRTFAGAPHHHFELGQRYLINADRAAEKAGVAPGMYWDVPDGVLAVRPCVEGPRIWTDDLSGLRPGDVQFVTQPSPIAAEPWPSEPGTPPYLIIAFTAAAVTGLAFVWRRGRRRALEQRSVGVPT